MSLWRLVPNRSRNQNGGTVPAAFAKRTAVAWEDALLVPMGAQTTRLPGGSFQLEGSVKKMTQGGLS